MLADGVHSQNSSTPAEMNFVDILLRERQQQFHTHATFKKFCWQYETRITVFFPTFA